MSTVPVPFAALQWLRSGNTGLSSVAIFGHMTGAGPDRSGFEKWSWPIDPADFARCRLLLEAVPEWRSRLAEMGEHNVEWLRLVDRWDDISASMDSEVPDWRAHVSVGGIGKSNHQSAILTYNVMKAALRGPMGAGDG